MKKCTKLRIVSALLWLAVGGWLIYEVIKTWYGLGCGSDSLIAALALYGTWCILFGLLTDSKIRDYFNKDDKFEYR